MFRFDFSHLGSQVMCIKHPRIYPGNAWHAHIELVAPAAAGLPCKHPAPAGPGIQ